MWITGGPCGTTMFWWWRIGIQPIGESSAEAYPARGSDPLVVSYATSPAAEVYFSEETLTESPTGAITAPGTCFRQIEYAGILKNGQNRDLAEAFIDFVLEDSFQNAIPLHMWVFPVSTRAELPQVLSTLPAKHRILPQSHRRRLKRTAKNGSRHGLPSCCSEYSRC